MNLFPPDIATREPRIVSGQGLTKLATTEVKKMKVMVTGGAGYIGSHTLRDLLNSGHECVVFDNLSNGCLEAVKRVSRISNSEVQVEIGNIEDRSDVLRVLRDFNPDAIMHLAGRKAVAESEEIPLTYYRENVSGSIELLRAMDEVGCRKIIFSSSATVYGVADCCPIEESHPCRPTNVYGKTKYFVEEIIKDWASLGNDRSAVVLRYFNPVGADSSGEIGEDSRGRPNNLMPYITKVAVGQLDELVVFGSDYDTRDGTGERDFIHVDDLAKAHLAALEYSVHSPGFDVFNVGCGRGVTVLEMIRAFEVACGQKLKFRVEGRRNGDVASSFASAEKAHRLLGWRAQHDIEYMCSSAWNWQIRNPRGYLE